MKWNNETNFICCRANIFISRNRWIGIGFLITKMEHIHRLASPSLSTNRFDATKCSTIDWYLIPSPSLTPPHSQPHGHTHSSVSSSTQRYKIMCHSQRIDFCEFSNRCVHFSVVHLFENWHLMSKSISNAAFKWCIRLHSRALAWRRCERVILLSTNFSSISTFFFWRWRFNCNWHPIDFIESIERYDIDAYRFDW